MLNDFPQSYEEALDWGWEEFEPYAQDLLGREISAENLQEWLGDESQFLEMIYELNGRLGVAVDQDNSDQVARGRRERFREQVWPQTSHVTNQLEQKLVDSKLIPPNYDIQLKRISTNLEIFHPDNVDLESEAKTYTDEYRNIRGNLKMEVNGASYSVYDVLRMLHIEPERAKREFIYKNILTARKSVAAEYDRIWEKLFALRQQIAHNAGYPDYRAYMWRKLNRQDYTSGDVIAFCEAIEAVVVPKVADLRDRQAVDMETERLQPWDQTLFMQTSQTQKPYQDVGDWLRKSRMVFQLISPRFGEHFDTMQAEGLLDLESRPNKSPWNYAERLPASNRSFIFINGRGGDADLFMLFHEFGHAVHKIEMSALPYMRQKMLPEEISEVASTTMELLAGDHLTTIYPPEQAEIVRRSHLSSLLSRLPTAAMGALFQHWAYTHPEVGSDPGACDRYWLSLCERFMPGIDYSGFEDDLRMQWREIFQVFVFPFYYIEYAFSSMGALQIWQNYRRDPQGAVDQFRDALSRGYTVSVPEFYALAGAKFVVDTETLKAAVGAIEEALTR